MTSISTSTLTSADLPADAIAAAEAVFTDWEQWTTPREGIDRILDAVLPAAETLTRERVERDLRMAAEGRRDYARNAPADTSDILTREANTFDNAAALAAGDRGVLYGMLPSSDWDKAGLPSPTL